jgi:hypothetical protein
MKNTVLALGAAVLAADSERLLAQDATLTGTPAATTEQIMQSIARDEPPPASTGQIQSDPAAASSAEKMVAPALPDSDSTPAESTGAVSPQPSTPSGRPSDVDAKTVEAAAEILKGLGVTRPSADRLREGESDETTPTQLFNEAEVRRLLSKDPTVVYQVVYQGTPLPDPMVVPWIRNRRVLQERFDKAVDALAQGRVTEARSGFEMIIQDFPETDQAVQARVILGKMEKLGKAPPVEPIAALITPRGREVIIQLDPNVRVSAVIVDSNDPNNNLAMVSGRPYRVGDTVRGFPNHKVVKIENSAVEIEVEVRGNTKQFRVPVLAQPRAN